MACRGFPASRSLEVADQDLAALVKVADEAWKSQKQPQQVIHMGHNHHVIYSHWLSPLTSVRADVFSGSTPTPPVIQRHPLWYMSEEGELSRQIGHGVAVNAGRVGRKGAEEWPGCPWSDGDHPARRLWPQGLQHPPQLM